MATAARRHRRTIDIWPGYVDALAALLMVVIFVLLVFVVAQAMLSRTVSMQDLELTALHREIAELTRQLGLAEAQNEELQGKTSALSSLISELMGEKVELNAIEKPALKFGPKGPHAANRRSHAQSSRQQLLLEKLEVNLVRRRQ